MKLVRHCAILVFIFVARGNANPALLPSSESNGLIQNRDVTSNCPTGYSQPANSNWKYCYMAHTTELSRPDAAAKCKSENGTLATVTNAFVNTHIYTLLNQAGIKWAWLGTKCFNGDISTCINDDNAPFVYNNFQPRQPTTNGDCVFMWGAGRSSQQWATDECKDTFPFACEVAAGSYAQTRCLDDWTEFQRRCYRIFLTVGGAPRDESSQLCEEAKGGTLVSINNEEVNNFLITLNCSTANFFRIGLQCPNAPKKGDTSTCAWDDGTPFSYNNFAHGEPIRSDKKYFGYMAKNGTWYADDKTGDFFVWSACSAPILSN